MTLVFDKLSACYNTAYAISWFSFKTLMQITIVFLSGVYISRRSFKTCRYVGNDVQLIDLIKVGDDLEALYKLCV